MAESGAKGNDSGVKVINTGGCYDCGGKCVLKVHVKDGVAIRVDTDDGEEPQLRACAKGRAMRRQIYAPDRLLYPQKRAGERGEGRFTRISWDEALDTVAAELTRIKETYGPEAILVQTLSGASGMLHMGNTTVRRFLKSFGGYSSSWGDVSGQGALFGSRATFGTLTNANSRDDLVNSRLIILWGFNPAETLYSTNTPFHIARAREAGARVIVVDPRYTDTAAVLGDEWIPVRPGTDTAMMAAMAHVMITENLHDTAFLDRHTVGFAAYRDYVLGTEDGVPKTQAWAAAKTGVAAEAIASFARRYATMKPAALIVGMAPGRSSFGEQFHRAASVLAAMTGNIGIHGGSAAGFDRPSVVPMVPDVYTKLFEGGPPEAQRKRLDTAARNRKQPHGSHIWDAILEGRAGGYPVDFKMAYIAFNNPLNQFPNTNKGVRALKKLESVIVHEQFLTATARFADILLPVTTVWERNDFVRPWMGGPYFIYQNKVLEPLGETKSDLEICRELAARLGVDDPFFSIPEEDAIRLMVDSMGDVLPEVTDYERFKREGVHKIRRDEPQVCFREEITDPAAHPFPTVTGKIEIYSDLIAAIADPQLPPIPKHQDAVEGPEDPLAATYPLQLITYHHRHRAHSCFVNNPWLKDLDQQRLWLNAQDAAARGIADGDEVRVFNARGELIVPAAVGERIMPGVVALGEGAWYTPDAQGRDRGGCPNVLIKDACSPGGAFLYNGCLVQAERFTEEG